jgi:hypothetical protein
MIDIKATVDRRGFTALEDMKKQLPFAVARALTQVAYAVVEAEKKEMQSAFDRPTRYVQNSLRVVSAKKADLTAWVQTKDQGKGTDPDRILVPEIAGGARGITRYERAMQATGHMPKGYRAIAARGERRDSFGNVSRTRWRTILNALRANRSASKGEGKRSGIFTLVRPYGKLLPGVYERTESSVTPLVIYIADAVYKARLDFYGVATRTVDSRFEELFDKSLAQALQGKK